MLSPSLLDGKRFETADGATGRIIGNVIGGQFLIKLDGVEGSQIVSIEQMSNWVIDPPEK